VKKLYIYIDNNNDGVEKGVGGQKKVCNIFEIELEKKVI
jgi:hypothetical protein